MPLGIQVSLGPGHIGVVKMPLGMEINLGPGDVVSDGVAALPKRGTAPSFRFVCCGQMAGWMKTPLGTEGDLGPGHIVLDGVPALSKRHTAVAPPPAFWPKSIVATIVHISYC